MRFYARLLLVVYSLLLTLTIGAALFARHLLPSEAMIAFESQGSVYRMAADGSDLQRLPSSGSFSAGSFAWSPDGYWLQTITPRGSHPAELSRMRADGRLLQYSPLPLSMSNYDWSPDGEWIVFDSYIENNTDIYVMRWDGTDAGRLTTNPEPDWLPAWSPDGAWIAFVAESNGQRDVFRIRPDGSHRQHLTKDLNEEQDLAWSPDGQWLAFDARLETGEMHIYRVRSDGTALQSLGDASHPNRFVNWSADGQWIIHNGNYDNVWGTYRMRADGSDVHLLAYRPHRLRPDVVWPSSEVPWHGMLWAMVGALLAVLGLFSRDKRLLIMATFSLPVLFIMTWAGDHPDTQVESGLYDNAETNLTVQTHLDATNTIMALTPTPTPSPDPCATPPRSPTITPTLNHPTPTPSPHVEAKDAQILRTLQFHLDATTTLMARTPTPTLMPMPAPT